MSLHHTECQVSSGFSSVGVPNTAHLEFPKLPQYRSLVGEHEQHTDQGESGKHGEDLWHAVVGIGELWEEHLEEGDVQEGAAGYSLEGAVGDVTPDALKEY